MSGVSAPDVRTPTTAAGRAMLDALRMDPSAAAAVAEMAIPLIESEATARSGHTEGHNWTGILVLDPIPGLDPGIAPWVEIMRAWRVETHESCQGGPDLARPDRGHAYPEPTIAFEGGPGAGAHAYSVARTHGLPVAGIQRVWKEQNGELTGPVWEIVFRRMATPAEAIECAEALAFERGDR